MTILFAFILIPLLLLVGIASVVWVASLFFGRRASVQRGRLLHAIGVTAVVCVALCFVALMAFRRHGNITKARMVSANTPSEVRFHTSIQTSESTVSTVQSARTVAIPKPPRAPQPNDHPGELAVRPPLPTDGNVMWLPLSDDVIAGLLSTEGAAAVAKLNESVPQELRQAYAMIPLSSPGTRPVLRQALASSVVREALTPKNIHAAVSATLTFLKNNASEQSEQPLLQLAEAPGDGSADAATATAIASDASQDATAPWLTNPGIGRLVVESSFQEASVPAIESLRPAIVDALKQRVDELAQGRWHGASQWDRLVSIDVSDAAIADFIVNTATKTQELKTVDGDKIMRKTYALVEFPEAVEQQVLGDVHAALKQNRAIVLCMTLGVLWLCSTLLSVTFRASQAGTFWKKLATVPALSILVVPCILAAVFMGKAMYDGKTLDSAWATGRITCSIDDVAK